MSRNPAQRTVVGQSSADSLASGFLTYLTRGNGQYVVRTHGHVPCWTPEGLRLCR
ncbi:hypothetical protein [Streptomyces sp. NPDC058145]|uniref:hypothetical protein n=1 Tax=Streptomyces sp. NPDC058145 TaxID=3346356 RepID=UPI0036E6B76F